MREIYFAEQKKIKGKVDKGRHDGKRAEVRRLEDAKQQVKDYFKGK